MILVRRGVRGIIQQHLKETSTSVTKRSLASSSCCQYVKKNAKKDNRTSYTKKKKFQDHVYEKHHRNDKVDNRQTYIKSRRSQDDIYEKQDGKDEPINIMEEISPNDEWQDKVMRRTGLKMMFNKGIQVLKEVRDVEPKFDEILKKRNQPTPSLLDQFRKDRELQNRLTENKIGRSFKISALKGNIHYLHEKFRFPMPDTLTDDEWKEAIEFKIQLYLGEYLTAKFHGDSDETVQRIVEKNRVESEPLTFTDDATFANLERICKENNVKLDNDGIRQLLLEVDSVYTELLYAGHSVPRAITTDSKWLTLLSNLHKMGRSMILKFLKFAYKDQVADDIKQMNKLSSRYWDAIFKEAHRIQRESTDPVENRSLSGNHIFLRFHEAKMKNNLQWQFFREDVYEGQNMLLDFGLYTHMNLQEFSTVLKEIQYGIMRFRLFQKVGFRVHFVNCNWPEDSLFERALRRNFQNIDSDPVIVHRGKDFEGYDLDNLVYLSPNSRKELTKFDPKATYVIGALVGKSQDAGKTIGVARKLDLKTVKLPLFRTIGMSPELNVDTCMQILSDCRHSNGDWLYACRTVGPRFFANQMRQTMGKNNTVDPNDYYVWKAHRELCPVHDEDQFRLSPVEYRRRYAEIIKNFRANPPKIDVHNFKHQHHKRSFTKQDIEDHEDNSG